jgi:hypothetical protein
MREVVLIDPYFDKSVLYNIFSHEFIVGDPECSGINIGAISIEQSFESSFITLAYFS